MNYILPECIEIDGVKHPIRNKGDFRVILDVLSALNDENLNEVNRIMCALIIFYEDSKKLKDVQTAADEMMKFINCGTVDESEETPQIMDWEKDFNLLVAPINKNLGYDVRAESKYTHWWTFMSGYMEIGECAFAEVVSIRKKRMKGKQLESWEKEFYNENRRLIDLPLNLSEEEKELFENGW